MEIDKAERVFVIKAETELDRAILSALTFLPFNSIKPNTLIIHNNYYKAVVRFIARVEGGFHDALNELHKEFNNEI